MITQEDWKELMARLEKSEKELAELRQAIEKVEEIQTDQTFTGGAASDI